MEKCQWMKGVVDVSGHQEKTVSRLTTTSIQLQGDMGLELARPDLWVRRPGTICGESSYAGPNASLYVTTQPLLRSCALEVKQELKGCQGGEAHLSKSNIIGRCREYAPTAAHQEALKTWKQNVDLELSKSDGSFKWCIPNHGTT